MLFDSKVDGIIRIHNLAESSTQRNKAADLSCYPLGFSLSWFYYMQQLLQLFCVTVSNIYFFLNLRKVYHSIAGINHQQ